MAIKVTRLNDRQAPQSVAYDLSEQMDGNTQLFQLPVSIPKYCEHHIVWNGQVYRNDANHWFYTLSAARNEVHTHFDSAPVGGDNHNLQFVCDTQLNVINE